MPINREEVLYIPNSLLMRNEKLKRKGPLSLSLQLTLSQICCFFCLLRNLVSPPFFSRKRHTIWIYIRRFTRRLTFAPSPSSPYFVPPTEPETTINWRQILRQRKLEVDVRMLRIDQGPLSTYGEHTIPLWMDKTLVPQQLSLTVKVENKR